MPVPTRPLRLVPRPLSAVVAAMRLGAQAAARWPGEDEWSDHLEHRLRAEWELGRPEIEWGRVGAIARRSWESRRSA